MDPSPNIPIDWESIADSIDNENSIVILGPDAYRGADGQTLLNQLLTSINKPANKLIHKYYPHDNLFLFSRGGGRIATCKQISRYYANQQPGQLLEQIAQIPFHIMINTTPDRLLADAFSAQGFRYTFDHYKKKHEPSTISKPSKGQPLIYNLLGSVEDADSLILTHTDLFDYFKSIFEHQSLPEVIANALPNHSIDTLLFLGVPFDKWYIRLILRELDIHEHHEDFIRFAADADFPKDVKTFCFDHFTIQFVDHAIPEFVQKIYEKCVKKEILRKKQEGSKLDQIKKLVALGNLEEAILQIVDLVEDADVSKNALQLSSRLSRLNLRRSSGVLSDSEITLQENKILQSLLDLIEKVEN